MCGPWYSVHHFVRFTSLSAFKRSIRIVDFSQCSVVFQQRQRQLDRMEVIIAVNYLRQVLALLMLVLSCCSACTCCSCCIVLLPSRHACCSDHAGLNSSDVAVPDIWNLRSTSISCGQLREVLKTNLVMQAYTWCLWKHNAEDFELWTLWC